MGLHQDVWTHDTCIVCQSIHSTLEEKEQHEKDESHKSKTVVYDFLSKELSCLTPTDRRSILHERYCRADIPIAGLDCICELNFSWSQVPLWACTICYVSGQNLESADDHLHSSYHKRNYLCEYHPDRYASMLRVQEKSSKDKHTLLEHEAVLDTLIESRGLMSPDVYILNERDRDWAYQKLGLSDEAHPHNYIVEEISDKHQMALCYICNETFLAFTDEDKFKQAWYTHISTRKHQRSKFMQTLVHEDKLEVCERTPPGCEQRTEVKFQCKEGSEEDDSAPFYGPTVGLEFLIAFDGSNDSFCELCHVVVPNTDISDHFASEYHIERFIKRDSPSKLLNVEYLKKHEIHEILVYCLEEKPVTAHKYFRSQRQIPLLLKNCALPEQRPLVAYDMEQIDLGHNIKAIWCEDCKEYVNANGPDAWNIHIFDDAHFEEGAKKALFSVGREGLIPGNRRLDDFSRSNPPVWEEQYSVSLGVLTTQDHCEFALQFIVKDALKGKLLCTCCSVECEEGDVQMFSYHARSIEHITRAMHSMNKKTMITLSWRFPEMNSRKPLIMDYLLHFSMDARSQNIGISVYDPVLACKLNCLGALPEVLFELAALAPEKREEHLLTVGAQFNKTIPMNVALRLKKIGVKNIDKEEVVLHCEECAQCFATSLSNFEESLAEHLLATSHWERAKKFRENSFDENQRVNGKESKIKVQQFKQPNEKKKVTWKWNDKKSCYEFVYAQLGLPDIRERKRFPETDSKTDFFCTLCAESFKATKLDLENHIRSFKHVFYFMHKHRPAVIPELQTLLMTPNENLIERHKNIRRLFARMTKGMEKDKQIGIPIYDFGERECEYADVKKALAEDRDALESPADKPKYPTQQQNVIDLFDGVSHENGPELLCLSRIPYRCVQQNIGEVSERLLALVQRHKGAGDESTSTESISLEHAKRQLLNVVHFDGMVELADGGAAQRAQHPTQNSESNQQGKEAEPQSNVTPVADAPIDGSARLATSAKNVPRPDSANKNSKSERSRRHSPPSSSSRRHDRSPSKSTHRNSQRHYSSKSVARQDRSKTPNRHTKGSKSPPPTKKYRESVSTSQPDNRSKSMARPMSRQGNRSKSKTPPEARRPVVYTSLAKRLHDLKTAMLNKEISPAKQFFPPVPAAKVAEMASKGSLETKTEPYYANKYVGGAYDPSYLEKTYPHLLRKSVSPPRGNLDDLTSNRAHGGPPLPQKSSAAGQGANRPATRRTSKSPPSSVERRHRSKSKSLGKKKRRSSRSPVSSESSSSTDTFDEEEIKQQLLNRLKNEQRREIAKKIQMRIPKELPAFKQQALKRQKAEVLRNLGHEGCSPAKKKFERFPVTMMAQQGTVTGKHDVEEARMEAISDSEDIIIEEQQPQPKKGAALQQQQKKISRWDLVDGKFIPVSDVEVASQPSVVMTSVPSIQPPMGGSPISTRLTGQQAAQTVLAQLAASTSAISAHQRATQPTPTLPTTVLARQAATAQSTPLIGVQQPVNPLPAVAGSLPASLLGTLTSALGVPVALPPHPVNQPPPPLVFNQPPPIIDPTELIIRKKMEVYGRDLENISNGVDFIEYMWKQGYDPIMPTDPPLLFNEVLKKRKGLIGASTLYQIICYGHPELETYYCGMCNHWTTVSEMFLHLKAPMHRLSYMFRNYKMYHRKAMEEQDEERRDFMLDRFATKIWEIESCGQCTNRMRCILSEEAIFRIWPEYINCIDHSWKIIDDDDDIEYLDYGMPNAPKPRDGPPPRIAPISPKHERAPTPPLAPMDIVQNPAVTSPNPMLFADSSQLQETSAQVRASIVAKKLELGERAGLPPVGLVNMQPERQQRSAESEANDKNEVEKGKQRSERGREEKNSSSTRTNDSKKRDRSRERSSRRSRSRTRAPAGGSNGKDQERDKEQSSRRRSSRSRTREGAKRSKSRTPTDKNVVPPTSSGKSDHTGRSWKDQTEEFLSKVGDKDARMYFSDLAAERERREQIIREMPAESRSLAERLGNIGPPIGQQQQKHSMMGETDMVRKRRQLSPVRPAITPIQQSDSIGNKRQQTEKQRVEPGNKNEMQRVIAAMFELQQEFERNRGYLSSEVFFRTCQEFGISPPQIMENRNLLEAAREFGVDIQSAYHGYMQRKAQQQRIGGTAQQQAPPEHPLPHLGQTGSAPPPPPSSSQQFNLQSMGVDPSKLQGLDPRTIQSILCKTSQQTRTVGEPAAPSPFMPRSRIEPHEVSLNESLAPGNYVYPSYEEEMEQAHRYVNPDIDSSINRLTYAFSRQHPQDTEPGIAEVTLAVRASRGRGPPPPHMHHPQRPELPRHPQAYVPPIPPGNERIGTTWHGVKVPVGAGRVSEADLREQPMEMDFAGDVDVRDFGDWRRQHQPSSSSGSSLGNAPPSAGFPARQGNFGVGGQTASPSQRSSTAQQAAAGQQQTAQKQATQQQAQKQTINPDLRKLAMQIGNDWTSLGQFSFDMLGLGTSGQQPQQQQQKP